MKKQVLILKVYDKSRYVCYFKLKDLEKCKEYCKQKGYKFTIERGYI